MNCLGSLKKTLEHWARQTGFIRRKKRLAAFDFLALMTVGQLGMKHPSLAGTVDAIQGVLSRVAMHRRFSGSAVAFMKMCSEYVIQQKTSAMISSAPLDHFRRILIFDSSGWDVSAKLKGVLPGSGGKASDANCKLQVCYEYKYGELSFFQMQPGNVPDAAYSSELVAHVEQGDLVLADLGYFNMKTFKQIFVVGAFFIFRLLIGTRLVDAQTSTPFVLSDILKTKKGNIHQMQIVLGRNIETQVCCRLVCLRVSPEVANERRRKLKITMRKKGRTPSKELLILTDWTLMVTNVPEQWLPAEMLRPFYSLRWQIELLFKQIKTVVCIHKSTTGKENRLRCEIYGKLIMAVIIHRIHADRNIMLWNANHKELSMEKLYKRIQERAFIILNLLLQSIVKALKYLEYEISRLIRNCLKSYQRSRTSTLQIIDRGTYPW